MADEHVSPVPSTPAVHPPTINHLFVLMLTTAFAFATYADEIQKFRAVRSQGPAHDDSISIIDTMLDAFFLGVVYFGLVVVVREAVRHRSFAWLAFGHWFLLLTGFQYLRGNCVELIQLGLYVHKREWWETIGLLSSGATMVLSGALWLVAAIKMRDTTWRVAAVGFVLTNLGLFAMLLSIAGKASGWWTSILPMLHIYGPIGTIYSGMAMAVVVSWIAAIFRKGPRYDWLHHLGLLVLIFFWLGSMPSFGFSTFVWWSGLYTHLLNWVFPI